MFARTSRCRCRTWSASQRHTEAVDRDGDPYPSDPGLANWLHWMDQTEHRRPDRRDRGITGKGVWITWVCAACWSFSPSVWARKTWWSRLRPRPFLSWDTCSFSPSSPYIDTLRTMFSLSVGGDLYRFYHYFLSLSSYIYNFMHLVRILSLHVLSSLYVWFSAVY